MLASGEIHYSYFLRFGIYILKWNRTHFKCLLLKYFGLNSLNNLNTFSYLGWMDKEQLSFRFLTLTRFVNFDFGKTVDVFIFRWCQMPHPSVHRTGSYHWIIHTSQEVNIESNGIFKFHWSDTYIMMMFLLISAYQDVHNAIKSHQKVSGYHYRYFQQIHTFKLALALSLSLYSL